MIEQIPTGSTRILGFKISGKLHDPDYGVFIPAVEAAIAAAGTIRLLAIFEDFHGWDLHAAWDDLKLGVKHYADFDRIAMVGDKKWEEWMSRISRPFMRATVKYFDAARTEDAWAWVREGI